MVRNGAAGRAAAKEDRGDMPSSPGRRLFRGYGPLAAVVVVFTLMAALVPTVGERVRTVTQGASGLVAPGGGPAAAAAPAGPGDPEADGSTPPPSAAPPSLVDGAGRAPARRAAPGIPAPGAGSLSPGPAPGVAAAPPPGPAGRPAAGPQAAAPVAGPCAGRARQIPSDPYSPPCIAFSGDNGGATSRGVSAERILLSARLFELPDFAKQFEDGPAAAFNLEPEELQRTMQGLVEYFNSRFQLYGRRFEFVFHRGRGDILAEFQGGGQEGAEADAVKTSEELRPFAETLAITTPFADALARRQVLNLGALYMSREWYEARRPYTWSATPDCTFVLESLSDYLLKRVLRKPAVHAGGNLQGKPRTLALIIPENPYYQECGDAADRILRAGGAPPALRLSYKIDINSLSNQAASLAAKLRNAQITTVLCGCDPVLPVFLTSKTHEQGYEPEWIITGVVFSDNDTVGQAYQQDQWSRAFGLSFLGTPQPVRASFGYHAFKAARPDEEPIDLVDMLYYHLYTMALGVQMAGPNLTPESFEAGLRAYPGGTGPAGTLRYSPGRYTPTQDAREIFYDPSRTSPINGKPGTYVEAEPGRRFAPGGWPPGDPPVFGAARPSVS